MSLVYNIEVRLVFILFVLVMGCSHERQNGNSRERREAFSVDSLEMIQYYQKKGEQIIQEAGKALASVLTKAISERGIVEAIEYCHLQALPITDSIAKVHHVKLRRTSHKVRNLQNAPDSLERHILQTYLTLSDSDTAFIVWEGKKIHFFSPILIRPLCLNCHGRPGEDIPSEVLIALKRHYPTDSATGFRLGELRGVWHLTFENY